MDLLIRNCANIDATSNVGATALMLAAEEGNFGPNIQLLFAFRIR